MKRFAFFWAAVCSAATLFADFTGHKIELDRPDGYYQVGDTAVCTVTLGKDGKPLSGLMARGTVYFEGKVVERRDFMTDGRPVRFSYRSDKPGWVYFRFEVMDRNGNIQRGRGVMNRSGKPTTVTEAGALFSPDRIRTGVKRPADFEAFWAERRAKLDKVPIEPKLTPLPDPEPGIKLYTVEVPCLGGWPVTGYLAIPANAKPKSLPAAVYWASWSASDAYPIDAVRRARNGFIGFAPTWHGRPANMGKAYYNYNTTIKINSGLAGIEDRETWCMGHIHYRVMRALDFVKSLPEWDGKTLVSMGGSLGGAQSVAAAALDKDVTTAIVNVPCFCEFDGWASGRKSSIPVVYIADRIEKGDRRPLNTCAYFDCVNFAPMIKCEIYVCTGFTDELCPPSSVYAFYNAIPDTTRKMMSTNPFTGHGGLTPNTNADKRLEKLRQDVKVHRYDVR